MQVLIFNFLNFLFRRLDWLWCFLSVFLNQEIYCVKAFAALVEELLIVICILESYVGPSSWCNIHLTPFIFLQYIPRNSWALSNILLIWIDFHS